MKRSLTKTQVVDLGKSALGKAGKGFIWWNAAMLAYDFFKNAQGEWGKWRNYVFRTTLRRA
jgi:hypothetical protein